MYLIDTATLELEEFVGEPPDYAILSHRWEEQEWSFQKMISMNFAQDTTKGWIKIKNFCNEARRNDLRYAWVDTCCFNKESSAELSETINSMYEWYANSAVCYVFLSDVEKFGQSFSPEAFRNSAWFTRGWTLQELLAPARVEFYDRNWEPLGHRSSLEDLINRATNIDKRALSGTSPAEFPIATRMSWAAGRQTTRKEDCAYCLMGLFGINMPLLYGEGKNAFIRLQEEIIKTTDDRSIFAWDDANGSSIGILASSPEFFKVSAVQFQNHTECTLPYNMTNQGLEIELQLTPWYGRTYLALLGNFLQADSGSFQSPLVGIFLHPLTTPGRYARVRCGKEHLAYVKTADLYQYGDYSYRYWEQRKIRVCRSGSLMLPRSVVPNPRASRATTIEAGIATWDLEVLEERMGDAAYGLEVSSDIPSLVLNNLNTATSGIWDHEKNLWEPLPGQLGLAWFTNASNIESQVKRLAVGYDFDFIPVVILSTVYYESKKHLDHAQKLLGLAEKRQDSWNSAEVDDGEVSESEKRLKLLWERLFLHNSIAQPGGDISSDRTNDYIELSGRLSQSILQHYQTWPGLYVIRVTTINTLHNIKDLNLSVVITSPMPTDRSANVPRSIRILTPLYQIFDG